MEELTQIPLNDEFMVLVDDADYERIAAHKWRILRSGNASYARRTETVGTVNGRRIRREIYMHREVMGAPPEKQVDHIDGNGLNNKRSNLRLATEQQNKCNRPLQRNNTSGFKGVHLEARTGRWGARIKHRGSVRRLGVFDDPEDAARAYDEAARRLHGKFARLNFDS